MSIEPIDLLFGILMFSVFVVLQSLFINGVHDTFKGYMQDDGKGGKVPQGMIGYLIFHKTVEKYKQKEWAKPFYTCVKCMASVWGAITFWPLVLYLSGFHYEEIFLFVFDVFILTFLNYYFYKKV